jgi:hypothetical protein
MTAMLLIAMALLQDPSRIIQEQQQREANRIGEEQRRQIEREQRERERQYREEMELAARRQREAQTQTAQIAQPEMRPPEKAAPEIVSEPKPRSVATTEPYNLRPIGIAMMAISALSIAGLLLHRRFTS